MKLFKSIVLYVVIVVIAWAVGNMLPNTFEQDGRIYRVGLSGVTHQVK
jgi:hypothetical protein